METLFNDTFSGECYSFSELFFPSYCQEDDQIPFGTPQFFKDDPKIFNELIPSSPSPFLVEPQIVDCYTPYNPAMNAIWNLENPKYQGEKQQSAELQPADLEKVTVSDDIRDSNVFSSVLGRVFRDRSMMQLSKDKLSALVSMYHFDLMNSMNVNDDDSRLLEKFIVNNITQKWTELNQALNDTKDEIERKVTAWKTSENPSVSMISHMQDKVEKYMAGKVSEADEILQKLLIEKEKILVAYGRSQQSQENISFDRCESNAQVNENSRTATSSKEKNGKGICKNGKTVSTRKGRNSRVLSVEATNILYEWFNSHKAHPYPCQAEKKELALRTGLNVKQVNNWFVNKRCREWDRTRRE